MHHANPSAEEGQRGSKLPSTDNLVRLRRSRTLLDPPGSATLTQ
jgi:hypothetical protein